ncbi:hypothetical protein [Escherichia albertii]|uniref:hypothetical protein n=1 Tax=Escherichia albertii TaxID=208962 RepID=UPI00223B9C15
MPFTTLNIPSISQLSPAEIQSLQEAARRENEIVISSSGWQYSISYVHVLGGFSVEPISGRLLDRLLRREHRMIERGFSLERRLNNGDDMSVLFDNYFKGNVALQNKFLFV